MLHLTQRPPYNNQMPHFKITSGRPTVTAEEIPSGQVDVATGVDTRLRRLENIVNNNFQELKRVIVTSSAGSEQLDDLDKESVGGSEGAFSSETAWADVLRKKTRRG